MKNQKKDIFLNKEKLFPDSVPRSRVQLDHVQNLRSLLNQMPTKIPSKIIFYKDIVREDGEYYLLYQGRGRFKPLLTYLNKNPMSFKKLLQEFIATLKLIKNLELVKKFFPAGINAFNFWIDEEENIFLMPEAFLQMKKNYSQLEVEVPVADYFTAPEIVVGKDRSLKSYLFNTAAVFYYFLSSETIFVDQDNAKVLNKIQTEKILDLKYLIPQISDQFNKLLMTALSKNESDRPELEELISDLKNINVDLDFDIKFDHPKKINNKKIVKKKRRTENVKLFFRQNWKIILFFLIIGGSFWIGLTSGPAAVITDKNSSQEVAAYFYSAVAEKNISLANEAVNFDLGELQRLISESYVIEKMQGAFNNESAAELKNDKVYSLENLKINEAAVSSDQHQYNVSYIFNFRDQKGNYSFQLEDKIVIKKINGVWKITAVTGDLNDLIAGKYPWRE